MTDPENNPENLKQNESAAQDADGATAPEATDLGKKIGELESQIKEKDSRYLYLYADFDNYKKRSVRERSDLLKFGWEGTARELLLVVDNLERALSQVPENTDKSWLKGLQMVLTQLTAALQKQGVQPVAALKSAFNPDFHEAVGQEPSSEPAGTIIQEHQRGYTLHGRLLRPARVIISSGPAQKAT